MAAIPTTAAAATGKASSAENPRLMPQLPRATIERQLEAAYNALETLGRERSKLQETIAGLSDNGEAAAALTAKDAAIARLTAENEALRAELSEYQKALGDLLAKIGEELSQTS